MSTSETLPKQSAQIPSFFLKYFATLTEPDYASSFLQDGGALNAAASSGKTLFQVTAGTSKIIQLNDVAREVVLEIPNVCEYSAKKIQNGGGYMLSIDRTAQLVINAERGGCAINGTTGAYESGRGAAYLANILRASTHTPIPIVFTNTEMHVSVVSISKVRVVDDSNHPVTLEFVERSEKECELQKAEELTVQIAETSWYVRVWANAPEALATHWHMSGARRNVATKDVPYEPAGALTKAVVCTGPTGTGINGSGFNLVHNSASTAPAQSWQTLDDLIQGGVRAELQEPASVETFVEDTKIPGLAAARRVNVLAASLCTVVCQAAYKPDGVDDSKEHKDYENWPEVPDLRRLGDCDNSALFVNSVLVAATGAPPEILEKYAYINAARNVLWPYYMAFGVVVAAARAPHASSTTNAAAEPEVAGHAVVLVESTVRFVAALDRSSEARDRVEAQFAAIFDQQTVEKLPEAERYAVQSFKRAAGCQKIEDLVPYAIEGTALASPLLYVKDDASARLACEQAKRDARACAQVGQMIAESFKILYVQPECEDLKVAREHSFYLKFLELVTSRWHPWWTNVKVRELGCAATHFRFSESVEADASKVYKAGVSPRHISTKPYTVVPMFEMNAENAKLLDTASDEADKNVVRPSSRYTLDKFENECLQKSLKSIEALVTASEKMEFARDEEQTHVLGIALRFLPDLVNSPTAVEQLCQHLSCVAHALTVDSVPIDGLAQSMAGEEVGRLVTINFRVKI